MIEYYVYETNPPPGARRASGSKETKKMAKKRKTPRRGGAGSTKKRSKKRRASSGTRKRRRRSSAAAPSAPTRRGKKRRSSSGRRRKARRQRVSAQAASRAGRTLRLRRRNPPRGAGWADLAMTATQGAAGMGLALSAPNAVAQALNKPALAAGWTAIGISAGGALAAGAVGRLFSRQAGKAMLVGGAIGVIVRVLAQLWPRSKQYLTLNDYVDVGIRDYVDVGIRDYVDVPTDGPSPALTMAPSRRAAAALTQESNYLYGDDDELDGDDEDALGGAGNLNYLTVSVPV